MSRIRSVSLLAKAQTAPLVPAGTIAATPFTRPSMELSVEVPGCVCPHGNIVRKPSGALCGTTVTFSEYACAVAGILHALLGTTNCRAGAPPVRNGPPNGPLGLRVSTTRQPVTGTKRRPGVPVPLSGTDCGLPAALSLALRVPEPGPTALGV